MPPSPLRLVRFTEPGEGAFTLLAPEGWSVQGGVARGMADPRPWYRVLSPGGGAELRGSDPRVPPSFLVPSWGFAMVPMPGVALRPYVAPEVFAQEYAGHFARELGASRFEVTGLRGVDDMLRDDPRPTTRPRVDFLRAQGAAFGGVHFVCADLGQRGIVDVTTLRMEGPMGFTWAPFVSAVRGPSEAWEACFGTLRAIAHSMVTNPAWQQMQSQRQQAAHEATMAGLATNAQILQMQHRSGMEAIQAHAQRAQVSAEGFAAANAQQMDAWRAQQAAQDESHRRAVNGIREEVDVYDPRTGQVVRGAPAGFDTWWTDGAGQVMGRHGHDNPDPSRWSEAVNLDDLPRPPRR